MTDDYDLPMVTGEKFYKLVDYCVEAQLRGGVGSATVPCFFGPPGVGKTQRVNVGYKDWKERNGSKVLSLDMMSVHIHPILLSQQDSVDVGGAYAPDYEKGELKHLLLKDILGQIKGITADLIIIFFDELANGNPATLAAIQSLLEDGQIRGVLKEKNCVYMAATNRPEDGCNAVKLPRALLDGRLVSFNQGVSPEEWVIWAKENQLHPKVINPIRWRPTLLYSFDPKAKGVNPTPRGWEKFSNLLWEMEEDDNANDMDILDHNGPGCIGNASWTITRGFWEHSECLPTFNEIIDDPSTAPLPNDGQRVGEPPSGQFAIAVNIADRLSQMSKEGINLDRSTCESIFIYLNRMQEEIAVFAVRICADAHKEFSDCKAHAKFQVDNKHITTTTI